MTTQAQIDANRLNSQKSTGPTSPEGKAISSLDALKSGIHAESEIIRHEDPAELQALSAAFHLEFQPVGANQLVLVDTLVSAEWTQRRLRRVEADLWNHRVECLDNDMTRAQFTDDSFQHTGPLGHAYHDALDSFNRLHRRIDSTNRLYLRTLKVLQALQAAALVGPASWPVAGADFQPVEPAKPVEQNSGPATPVSEPPSPVEAQPLIPPTGFVPHFANPTAFAKGDQPLLSHGKLPIARSTFLDRTILI